MSDDQVRRPRRIIVSDEPPAPETTAARALAERFARSLAAGASRRTEPARSPRMPLPFVFGDRRDAEDDDGDSAIGDAPRALVDVMPAEPPASGPVHQSPTKAPKAASQHFRETARGVERTEPQAHESTDAVGTVSPSNSGLGAPSSDQQHAAAGLKPNDDIPDWGSELVKKISVLCRAADPAFRSWAVSLPLDEAVLPQTSLRLVLSPHHLALRFHTDSGDALNLISMHRTRLVQLLERALVPPRDIDVDVT